MRQTNAASGLVLLLSVVLLAAPPLLQAAPPVGYYLVWAEEFNGGTLDASKWNIESGARRQAINTPSAVSLNGSNLVITTYTSNGTHYTALVQTSGKFNPRFGYTEASIKWGDSPGMWSAFWMWTSTMTTVGDVAVNGAEIDVCEHRQVDANGNNINGVIQANIHWDGYGSAHKSVGSGNVGSGLGSGFHTYALRWDAAQYRILIDDVQRWSTTSGLSQRSENLILSSEVENGSWAGNVPAGGYGSLAASTTRMFVDYVRFYAPTTTLYWTGGSSGDWTNSANWVGARIPASGNDIVFSYHSTANRATLLNQNLTAGSVAFLETSSAVSITGAVLTVNSGGLDVVSAVNDPTVNSPLVLGAAQTWRTRSGRTLIVNGPVSGSANLTLDGYGAVRLTASNSLTGKIFVKGGTLVITNENQLGPNPGAFTADKLTLDGGVLRSGESGSLANVEFNDANRGITLGAGGGTFQTFFNTSFTISNVISGPGALTKASVGALNLGAASTFSGDTRVNQGTLVLLHPNALQNSTLDLNTNDSGTVSLNHLNAVLGGLSGGRDLNLGNGAVTIGNNGSNAVYSGTLSGGGPLTKTGAGTLTLASSNVFTGAFLVSQGVLQVDHNNALGTTTQPTIVAGGAEVRFATAGLNVPEPFTLSGAANALHTVGGAGGLVTLSGNLTLGASSSVKVDGAAPVMNLAGNVSLAANSLTMALDGAGTSVIGGVISGSGALVKSGTGTLRLDNANTFGGETRITAGTLALNHANALQNSTVDLNVADAGTLSLNNLAVCLGGLKGARNLDLGSAGLAVGNNGQSTEYAGSLTGAGALTKLGAGTLTLAGTNNFAGGLTVTGGALNVAGVTASGPVVVGVGAMLTGRGTLLGAVTVPPGGVIAPGAGIGALTVSNALVLSGTTQMELNKEAATNDLIRGMVNVNFGGTLSLTNLAGTLAAGDRFKLFDAAGYSGAFTNLIPASPGPGLTWNTSGLNTNGLLSVVALPPPQITGGARAGSNQFVLQASGSPGQTYSVYAASDAVLPWAQWIWLGTATADAGGAVSFTDTQATNGQRFYRLAAP